MLKVTTESVREQTSFNLNKPDFNGLIRNTWQYGVFRVCVIEWEDYSLGRWSRAHANAGAAYQPRRQADP